MWISSKNLQKWQRQVQQNKATFDTLNLLLLILLPTWGTITPVSTRKNQASDSTVENVLGLYQDKICPQQLSFLLKRPAPTAMSLCLVFRACLVLVKASV